MENVKIAKENCRSYSCYEFLSRTLLLSAPFVMFTSCILFIIIISFCLASFFVRMFLASPFFSLVYHFAFFELNIKLCSYIESQQRHYLNMKKSMHNLFTDKKIVHDDEQQIVKSYVVISLSNKNVNRRAKVAEKSM